MRLSLPAFVVIAVLSSGMALSQTPSGGSSAAGTPTQPPAADVRSNTDTTRRDEARPGAVSTNTQLEPGANSFTEGQVRSRLEDAGFRNVTDLTKDDQGIWRGKAMQNGRSVNVGFDYKGRVAAQ